jgi:hypothetical protein
MDVGKRLVKPLVELVELYHDTHANNNKALIEPDINSQLDLIEREYIQNLKDFSTSSNDTTSTSANEQKEYAEECIIDILEHILINIDLFMSVGIGVTVFSYLYNDKSRSLISGILLFKEYLGSYNYSILLVACYIYEYYDDRDILDKLLNDVNIRNYINFVPTDGKLWCYDYEDMTILSIIIKTVYDKVFELTKLLIEKGANVNLKYNGFTPLKLLISRYKRCDEYNRNRNRKNKYLDIIKFLLDTDTVKYGDIVSSLLYLNNVRDKLYNVLDKKANAFPEKHKIYKKIYSIITELSNEENTYLIKSHGRTIHGSFLIPDNICICVPVKTNQPYLSTHQIKLPFMERIYFPGYSMKNIHLNFDLRNVSQESGVIQFNPETYEHEHDHQHYKILSEESLCREFILEKKFRVTLKELVDCISKSDENKIYCLFLAACRVEQGNNYDSNNEASPVSNSHGIDILPSIYLKNTNRNTKIAEHTGKQKINNFKKSVKNLYNKVRPFEILSSVM